MQIAAQMELSSKTKRKKKTKNGETNKYTKLRHHNGVDSKTKDKYEFFGEPVHWEYHWT